MYHGEVSTTRGGRAVFLDRDGVLIEDTGYPDDPEKLTLLAGVGEALRTLRAAGWRLVAVSNQSGVARGILTLECLAKVNDRLLELLCAEGVALDALLYCPHHPEAGRPPFDLDCDHRKPGPGMLFSAAARLELKREECWMVGDKESDVGAAHAAGVRAIRIGDGSTAADLRAADLAEAAWQILERGK